MTRRRPPSWSERVYAVLIQLLCPPSFRDRFGQEMGDFFRDRLHDERARRGRTGDLVIWARALPDLVSTALREHAAAFVNPLPTPPSPPSDSMSSRLFSDARFALRGFRKHPVFFGVAVLVVALGTGAVSTIFSVANAVVLRPLPGARDASALVEVGRTRTGEQGSLSASYPYYEYVARHSTSLDGLAAWGMVPVTLSTGNHGVQGLGNAVSGSYFSVLGVQPFLGTLFAGSDDRALAGEGVVVISHAYWQRELAGDSTAIGRPLSVNGRALTIVGVAPPRFVGVYPALRTDVWIPVAMGPELRGEAADLTNAGISWMQLVGRLKRGTSASAAQRELSAVSAQYVSAAGVAEPKGMSEYTAARVDRVAGLPAEVAGAVAGFLGVLLAIAALVLLIASVNVASMLLARAVVRRREIAMRIALGATRLRLVRQLLVESLLLFGLGGAAGTLLAVWGTRLLQRVELPIDVPLSLDVSPDVRVLVVTLLIALATGVLFGLAPALQGSRTDVQSTLRSDSAGSGRRRSRLRDGLIVGQIALSLLLLSSAGLFIRALGRGRTADPGFQVDGVVTAALDVGSAGYPEARGRALYRDLAERLGRVPGVQSVAYARVLPLSMNISGRHFSVPGQVPPGGHEGDAISVNTDEVDGGYFRALRIPLVSGRVFLTSDDEQAPRVAVINETFARRYFPAGDALGATIREDSTPITIVGIVRDSKFAKLDEEAAPFLYQPAAQIWSGATNLLVHTLGTPEAVTAALLREVSSLDPSLPSPRVTTLRQSTAVVLLPQRIAAAVTGALGLTGLLLAAVGLYGILSFSTAQRTREMGVRLALGASRTGIVQLVLGEGLRLVVVGITVGLVLAGMATRALRPFLFGISPLDPLAFASVGAVLLGVSLLAIWLPARRASGVDPMRSMRAE
ncbi:MAG: ABC transporter permease [Gemmatimonadota bacterium]